MIPMIFKMLNSDATLEAVEVAASVRCLDALSLNEQFPRLSLQGAFKAQVHRVAPGLLLKLSHDSSTQ